MLTGKSANVAQPSSFEVAFSTGGVQSSAPGRLIHVPPVTDCEEFEHTVPSLGANESSNVGAGTELVLAPPTTTAGDEGQDNRLTSTGPGARAEGDAATTSAYYRKRTHCVLEP